MVDQIDPRLIPQTVEKEYQNQWINWANNFILGNMKLSEVSRKDRLFVDDVIHKRYERLGWEDMIPNWKGAVGKERLAYYKKGWFPESWNKW